MTIIPTSEPTTHGDGAAESPAAVYERRFDRFSERRSVHNARRYLAANLTVALFFGIPVCLGIAVFALLASAPLFAALGLLFAVAFVAAFAWQTRLDAAYRRYDLLCTLASEGLARLRRDWSALPLPPAIPGARVAEYAADLDILGRASLQQLLGGVAAPAGQITLHDWLMAPAAPDVIRERQAASAELAPSLDFREELALAARQTQLTPTALARFLTWAGGGPWLTRRPWLVALTRLSPLLLFLLLGAELAGLTRYPLWLLFLGLNLLLTTLYGKQVEELLGQVSERQASFRPYGALFDRIAAQPFEAPLLVRLQQRLATAGTGGRSAAEWMRRLARILNIADLRLSMFFAVIQATTLWSFHSLWLLERWQRAAGAHVRDWLETLSELDALAALATLAFENPSWAYPQMVEPLGDQRAIFAARNLGHPLLPPATCVGNDITAGPPGRFVFVTGSNMSGKSTLLRALGSNIVLAQMGAPVCAVSLAMPPIALATSIRVQDSLEQGVSYFLAELHRLRDVLTIVEATTELEQVASEAREASPDFSPQSAPSAGTSVPRREPGETTSRIPFFLLDEILHGTNTAERQVAARSILRHLLALGATGAVSTHDLSLADTPDLEARRTAVYFTEQFTRGPEGPAMRFDYLLRPGVAPSTNALKLMEIVGLPLDEA
jgi:predicted ATPase